jgi:hypothetical protein
MENNPKDKELDRLFAAARKAELYDENREHGFETRVMAKIRARREGKMPFLIWAWRLIPVFVSLVILLGIWISVYEPAHLTDLSEVTRIGNEDTMLVAYLAGE